MLEHGIPAKDIGYKVLNARKPGEVALAIEQFLSEAKAENLSVYDISFVSRGDEILVIGFFKQPK